MNIFCEICTEPFGSDCVVCTTICGHLFHEGCVLAWFKRSESCPTCRTKSQEYSRVFLNFEKQEDELDVGKIMHQIHNLKDEVRSKNTEIEAKTEEINKLRKVNKRQNKSLLQYSTTLNKLSEEKEHQIDVLHKQAHLKDIDIKAKEEEIKKLEKDNQEQSMSILKYSASLDNLSKEMDKLSKEKKHQLESLQKKCKENSESLNDLRKQLNASHELEQEKHAKMQNYSHKYDVMLEKFKMEEEKYKSLDHDSKMYIRTLQRISNKNLQFMAQIKRLKDKLQRANLKHSAQYDLNTNNLTLHVCKSKKNILEISPVSQPKKRRRAEDSSSETMYCTKHILPTCSNYYPENSHADRENNSAESINEMQNADINKKRKIADSGDSDA